MESIDKNDVDIKKLFEWKKKVYIGSSDKGLDVYMRLLGDADLNRCRVFALRESAILREELRDEESDKRIAFIPTRGVVKKQELINGILVYYTQQFSNDAAKDLKIIFPKEPDSEASLEDQEEYQKTIDNFPKKRREEVREYIEERIEQSRKDLSNKSYDWLYGEFVNATIDQMCQVELLTKFREMCVFLGSYIDEDLTKKVFDNFEDFTNLPVEIKNNLIEEYIGLEIESSDLKK